MFTLIEIILSIITKLTPHFLESNNNMFADFIENKYTPKNLNLLNSENNISSPSSIDDEKHKGVDDTNKIKKNNFLLFYFTSIFFFVFVFILGFFPDFPIEVVKLTKELSSHISEVESLMPEKFSIEIKNTIMDIVNSKVSKAEGLELILEKFYEYLGTSNGHIPNRSEVINLLYKIKEYFTR